jgi:hypothetical protein
MIMTGLTPAATADTLRHLVADTIQKMNDEEEERDRQYLLEDMITRLVELATELDGHYGDQELMDNARITVAYPLLPREPFGDLAGQRLEDLR